MPHENIFDTSFLQQLGAELMNDTHKISRPKAESKQMQHLVAY